MQQSSRFLSKLPGLRIIPNSTLALAPAAHQATVWPSAVLDLSGMPAWPVGPVVRLHLLPEPYPLVKAAVQRMVTHKLRGSSSTRHRDTPFRHHWELTVRIAQSIPLHQRQAQHEEYTLHATGSDFTHVHLQAASEWGALMGLQSLRMLLDISHSNTALHAAVRLPPAQQPWTERPAVGHRAVRVPFGMDLPELRHAIDESAQIKYNVLQWEVLQDGRLAHPLGVIRMLVQYAYQRGLQVLFELASWGPATPEQQAAFLRLFLPLSTAPLVHVGDRVALPGDFPHAVISTHRQAGTVHEASPSDWQPGDIVRLQAPDTDDEYRQLAVLDLTGVHGASVAWSANLLVRLQVAALLWSPESQVQEHHDPRLEAAVAALWHDQGVKSTQAHPMDLDTVRLHEAHHGTDGGLIQ